jgi:signal transduction histidine kinase
MQAEPLTHWRPRTIQGWTVLSIVIGIVYCLSALLSLKFAFLHDNVSAVWIPTGLALGAVLVYGYKISPSILFGLCLLNLVGTQDLPWSTNILIMIGNTSEALVGAILFKKISGQSNPLYNPKTFLIFLSTAVFSCTMISATIGVSALCLSGIPWTSFSEIWITWWLGDSMGALIIAPAVYAVCSQKYQVPERKEFITKGITLSCLCTICYFVFSKPYSGQEAIFPRSLLLMPALAWIAYHCREFCISLAVVIVTGFGVWCTLEGMGPFARHDANDALLTIQSSMGLIAGTVLLFSSLRSQQLRDEQGLKNEQALLKELLEVQENERRMVAHDIHDGFIQDIVGAHMKLQTVHSDQEPEKLQNGVNTVSSLLSKAITEGRRMIQNLRPLILDESGVVEAIKHLIADEENHSEIKIDFQHDVQFDRLDPKLEGTIFRIVQESISNAKKHSGADHVTIKMVQDEQCINIVIQDQGVGFNPEQVSLDGFGLRGIYERTKLYDGLAEIDSQPQSGTKITIQIPLAVPVITESV